MFFACFTFLGRLAHEVGPKVFAQDIHDPNRDPLNLALRQNPKVIGLVQK
jgi:hypothetical protein